MTLGTDWLLCVGVLAFIALGCILIPENAIKKKDSPYEVRYPAQARDVHTKISESFSS